MKLLEFYTLFIKSTWYLWVAVALAVIISKFWYSFDKNIGVRTNNLGLLLVNEQIKRAKNLSYANIVIVGDSSGLMNIDALKLEKHLNVRVENLSTMQITGPHSYGLLLKQVASRAAGKLRLVLLVLHPDSVDLNEKVLSEANYENYITEMKGPIVLANNYYSKVRQDLLSHVVDLQIMPGAYGNFYGSADNVLTFMNKNRGSLIDPNFMTVPTQQKIGGKISAAFAWRWQKLGKILQGLEYPLAFIMSPVEQNRYNQRIIKKLKQNLIENLRVSQLYTLNLPEAFTTSHFATATHLNRIQRSAYSDSLAKALKSKVTGL